MTFWTAIGVAVAVLAQVAQYVHMSNTFAAKFAILETDNKYLRDAVKEMKDDVKDMQSVIAHLPRRSRD